MNNNIVLRSNPLKDKSPEEIKSIYTKMSASKYKTFLECPRKFYYSYIDKLPRQDTEIFTFGSAVHHGLETIARKVMETGCPVTTADYEESYQAFRDYMSRVVDNSAIIHNTALFEEGEKLIKEELDRRRADLVPEKIIAVEQEFDIEFPEGVRINGFIDKIVQLDDNTIKIVDYKTSNTAMSWQDARTDEQLSMYDLAAFYIFPQFPNRIVELNYLRLKKTVTSSRTDTQRYSFRQQLFSVRNGLLKFVESILSKEDGYIPEGKLSTFCSWCQFKHSCNTYNNSLIQVGSAFKIPEVTPSSFLTIYKDIKNTITELEQLKRDLTKWALIHLDNENNSKITNGTEEVYTLSNSNRTYSAKVLAEYLDLNTLLGCVDVSNSKLDEILSNLPSDVVAQIQQSAQYRLQSPQIRTRKVK